MRLVQHYNDLTEINQLRYFGDNQGYYSNPDRDNLDKFLKTLAEKEKECKTRVLFTDVKNCYSTFDLMKKAPGWVHGRHTLDWHQSHGGDNGVNLFYKLFPDNKSDPNNKKERERGTYMCHQSLAGSCSMGLVNGLDKWLKSPGYPERYITLVRLQRKRTPEEIAKMRYFHYRLVFKSDVARYFINGWHPDQYPFKDAQGRYQDIKEREWWTSKEAPSMRGWEKLQSEKFPEVKKEAVPAVKICLEESEWKL